MSFVYPLGLLGLLGVPVLILIYVLRSKYNEQTVASTYLWTLSEKFFKRRNPLSGITGIISLILQILMVVFLSLAISRPIFTIPNSASEYCFILDASGSMNSKNGFSTDFEKGKDYIEDCINKANLGSSYTLITTSFDGEVIYERVTDKKLAINMLRDLSCTDSPSEDGRALALAQKYFGENNSTILYFVTDKDYETSKNIEIVNVGLQNAKNFAISEVSGTLTDGTLYANGVVKSYTEDAELTIELYLGNEQKAVATKRLSVKKGEERLVELSCKANSYESFRLVIANNDDLMADNEVVSYNLKSEASYSILIVSDTPFFLEAAFDALTDSVVDSISPENYNGQIGYGLYVFDSFTPDVLPDGAVWLINSSESVADSGFSVKGIYELDEPQQIVKSTSTSSKVRGLLEGVKGERIFIKEYVKYSSMYAQFSILFSHESNPLIFAGVNPLGNREVVIGFDLHKSDLVLLDFIPLISNLLEYSCPDILERTDYVCGDEAEINITANIDSIKTISPDGEENYVDTSTDIGKIPLDKVGTYTVKVMAAGEEKVYKIYSAAHKSESDPFALGGDLTVEGVRAYEKTDGEFDPLTILFVLLAVVFAADWMVYCYEKYQLR